MTVFAALVGACVASTYPPQQVHLAFGKTETEMSVSWATHDGWSILGPKTKSIVHYGLTSGELNQTVEGDVRGFISDLGRFWHTHAATMTGLRTATKYFYKVGDDKNGYSPVYSFTSQTPAAELKGPQTHVLMGDMGAKCSFSLCLACGCGSEVCDAKTCATNRTDVGMIGESDASMFLHVGDFAYDLSSNKGTTGDNFMKNIEQVAAHTPYMVSHGNHEDAPGSLSHYLERFRHMPVNSEPKTIPTLDGSGKFHSPNTLFFSWNDGLVHYVAISTEIWFNPLLWLYKEAQLKWLKADLEAANKNRANVPWIVVHGHRSVYCSCDKDCDAQAVKIRKDVEDLFFDNGVDFFVNGHEHNYERSWPVYQNKSDQSNVEPKATIYIVTGAAGCKELHEPFTRPQPPRTAFRSNTFGYSRMIVHNSSHVRWQQVQTDPTLFPGSVYGRVIDDTWVVQHNHGPFSKAAAPKDHGVCTAETCKQYDHWGPLLGMDAAHIDRDITAFRQERGEQAWQAKLEELRKYFASAQNNERQIWEDVREDGASDGAWVGWKGGSA
eukprot:TRINITY_DN581_c0_g3_i1.p1 TRINITY_DN581_c0_g3~~TRINITY_DN581_c0_g3_i1.p1  ORF type:complete len:552 (+),score=214.86 TRINITY_DN581_c0_g3_i1:78-1733(+)